MAQSQGSDCRAHVLFLKLEILEVVMSFKIPNAYKCARGKTFLISFNCSILEEKLSDNNTWKKKVKVNTERLYYFDFNGTLIYFIQVS